MIPYTTHEIRREDEEAILRVLRSRYLTQGPEVEAFEAELAEKAGAKYAVAVNSGTAALHLAYRVAGFGFGPITAPAISFVATASAAILSGLDLAFQDVDPLTGLASTELVDVFVTLGGNPAIGPAHVVINDSCHGPLFHDPLVDATCFSFHPAKHCAAGEGGAVLTNSWRFADQCRLLRSHGRRGTETVTLGHNYRLPELSAALARSQLQRYDWNVDERRKRAAIYDEAFDGHPVIQPVKHSPDSARHLYQILLPPERRDAIQHALTARGIGTAIHYPPIPLQPYYREKYGYKEGMFPGAESYAARTLSIPLYPTLTMEDQCKVIAALWEVAK